MTYVTFDIMDEQEMMKDIMQHDIRSKIRNYLISQRKVFVKTKPSGTFPKGKFFNGYVMDINPDFFSFRDDVDMLVDIYYSEITSTRDIQDSRRV